MTTGRIIGIILMIVGLAICGIVTLFLGLGISGSGPARLSAAGGVLGIALFGVAPLLVLGGIGMFMFIKGGQEAAEMTEVQKKERLVGMAQAAGHVSLSNANTEAHHQVEVAAVGAVAAVTTAANYPNKD